MPRSGRLPNRAATFPLNLAQPLVSRLLVVLTTTPWTDHPALSQAVSEHLANLGLVGWTIRRAQTRNYLLWRQRVRLQSDEAILVLPNFAAHVPRQVATALVLADILAAERPCARRQLSATLMERHAALSLSQTGLTPSDLAPFADALLLRAAENGWLL
jgi:hypothetical protein